MGSARIGRYSLDEPATHFDADSALLAFDECLEGYRHPVPKVLRRHVLEIATGIAARTPAALCADVNGRLKTILRRHGIFINDLRSR